MLDKTASKSVTSALLSLLAVSAPGCLDVEDGLDDEVAEGESAPNIDFRAAGSDLDADDVCPNVLNDGIGLMRYCRSRNIYVDNNNVEKAIIVIHGSGLDAKNYYDRTRNEAIAEGVDLSKTDIIAPQYFEADTPNYDRNPWTNYYVWNSGWRWGNLSNSHTNRPSFAMIDHIIGQLLDHRPNLQSIVVAGQSAGGQFVDRYAVGTDIDTGDVDIRFWAANPSSNVWYNGTRPEPTCSGYNNYGYGLDNRNTYMSGSTTAEIRDRAVTRDIFWTVGENDTGTAGLDSSCRANSQGGNRNERWSNHRDHVGSLCTSEGFNWLYCLFHTQRHIEIPGCGHGSSCSWASAEGHDILFGS